MALQVKKAESFGDLIVRNGPQQKLTVSSARPQQNITVNRAPANVPTISGVRGPQFVPPMAKKPMDDPLGWFGNTLKSYAQGVAEVLNPITAFSQLGQGLGQAAAYNTKDSQEAREAQTRLQEENLRLIGEAQKKLRDPKVSDAEKARWQRLVDVTSRQALGQYRDMTEANDQLIQDVDPVVGALNTAAVGTSVFGGKQGVDLAQDLYAAVIGSKVKQEALDTLLRSELLGTKHIPVTKTGGGDVPIPVRVSTKIPVRAEASDEVLDARLSREVDIMSGRHINELDEASRSKTPLLGEEQVNTKYNDKYAELIAQRDAGTIPQRIEITDGNVKPGRKAQQLGDPSKIKTEKQLRAERVQRAMDDSITASKKPKVSLKEKPSPVDNYIPDKEYGKSPGLFTRSWRSVAGVLEKNGTGGKAINRGVQNSRDYAEKATGNYMTDLEQAGFKHIDDARFVKVWDAVESGSAKGLDGDERRLAAALIRTMNRIHKSATDEAGMDIGDRGATYLPHWFKEGDKDMAQFFEKKFNQRNSNLENKRLTNEEGYEKTKESIARYVQNATERIGRAKEFGQNDEKLKEMFDVAAREGYDIKQLERYAETALGRTNTDTTGHKISAGIRQYEAVTSLQKSAVANLGQPTNTMTITGVKNWAKATYKYWSDPTVRDWAKRSGVFGDHVLGNLQKQYAGTIGDNMTGNKAVQVFKKHFLVPGMQAVEKFNRANGVIAGRYYAEDLAKKAATGNKKATRLLQQMLPDYKPGMELTDDMLTDAGRNVVKRAQFKVDPVDLPNWTNSAVGKLIFQFRSFGYKQTQFMAREVIGEALNGNFAPMTRFLALGVPVGYGIHEARSMLLSGGVLDEEKRKEFMDKSGLTRVFEGFSQIGGGGMPLSEGMNIARSVEYADSDNKVRDAATSTLGPAVNDLARAGSALNDAVVKGEYRNGSVFLAQQIPIVGPIASKFTKDYFKTNTEDPTTMNADEFDKYKSRVYSEFTKNMSDKDKDLMEAVGDDDYARMGIKNGKFTQDQIDEMQATYNREKFKKGLPIKYVKGVTDEEFNTFDDTLKGLVMEASLVGIKKFAESDKYDPTAEAVMKKAMESAWPEVGEIKGNNQLALDYLKAQRDYTEAGKTDDQGKQFDIVKGFWGKAIKEQYSEKTRNLYNNSLADIKRLYEGITVNGKKYEISREDMDAAVALDDRLIAAGLRDTPKFSDKTRKEFGYAAAGTSKVEGVGYQGKKTSTSGSGGSGGSGGGGNPYSKTISRGSRSSLNAKSASASGGKARVKLAGASGGGSASKPKVSIKKNKV